jgi:putative endonuclease
MRDADCFSVYIVTNQNGTTLYIGVTSDLEGRIWEHKNKIDPKSFTARYHCDRLVWFENFPTAAEAIACEKQLKGWLRIRKVEMINAVNPKWRDLSEDWTLD